MFYGEIADDADVQEFADFLKARGLQGSTRAERALRTSSLEALEVSRSRVADCRAQVAKLRKRLFDTDNAPFSSLKDMRTWIERQRKKQGPPTEYQVARDSYKVNFLDFFGSDTQGAYCVPVAEGGKLDQIRAVSKRLADKIFHGHDAHACAQCTCHLLVGTLPLIHPITLNSKVRYCEKTETSTETSEKWLKCSAAKTTIHKNLHSVPRVLVEHAHREGNTILRERFKIEGTRSRPAPKSTRTRRFLKERAGFGREANLREWNRRYPEDSYESADSLYKVLHRQ